jgi:hypothetical protein
MTVKVEIGGKRYLYRPCDLGSVPEGNIIGDFLFGSVYDDSGRTIVQALTAFRGFNSQRGAFVRRRAVRNRVFVCLGEREWQGRT